MGSRTLLFVALDLTVTQPQSDISHLLYIHSFTDAFQTFINTIACNFDSQNLFLSTAMFPFGKLSVCSFMHPEVLTILNLKKFAPFNYEQMSLWRSQLLSAKSVFDNTSDSFSLFILHCFMFHRLRFFLKTDYIIFYK